MAGRQSCISACLQWPADCRGGLFKGGLSVITLLCDSSVILDRKSRKAWICGNSKTPHLEILRLQLLRNQIMNFQAKYYSGQRLTTTDSYRNLLSLSALYR